MRIKAKRFISLCLAIAIIATSVGYGPPAVGAEYMPYIELEEDASIATPSEAVQPGDKATPSEAVRPGDKATPSEAVPPEEKATPSEAERKFISVKPEEIPEYYQKASYAGRRFWKFEDRYGNVQYRDFGFVQGEAEFPLWYEADENGVVNEEFISISLNDEYYDLAPYILESQEPNDENWNELERQYEMTVTNKEKLQFDNWNGSNYEIWHVKAKKIEEDDIKASYFFFGYIKNIKNGNNAKWFESDKNGEIKIILIQQRAMLLDNYRSLKLYFYNNIPGETDSNSPSYDLTVGKFRNNGFQSQYSDGSADHWMTFDVRDYSLPENTQMITFPNLEKEGYKFLGYLPEFFSSYSPTTNLSFFANDMQTNPQNYDYLVGYDPNFEIPFNDKSGATLYVPAASFMHPIKSTSNLMNTTTGFPLIKPDSKTSVAYLIGGINSSYINMTDRPNSISFYGVWEKQGMAKLSLIDNTRPIYSQWDANNVQFNMFNTSLEHYRSISYKEFGTTIDISNLLAKDPFSGIYAYDTVYLKDYINYSNSRFGGYFSKIAGGGERLNIKNYTYDKPDDKYYAYWYNPNNSFSVYYFDDENFTNRLMKETVKAGGKSIPPDAPIKPGYIFTHWEDPNSPSMRPDYIVRTSTFVPKYVKEEYFKVTFMDWDGKVISDQNIQIGSNAIPPADPVREGHTFLGWDKPYINIQNDVIITAQYKANNFYITLDANGGLFNSHDGKTEISFEVSEGYDLNSIIYGKIENKPSMQYHAFEGWYTERVNGDKYDESKSNIMPSSDLNLYAHWNRTSSEVIFKDWDGSEIDTQEVVIGGNAIPPADPTRAGYTFIGWDKPSINIQTDTIITAQYSKNGYTLTLDGNGGMIGGDFSTSQVVTYGQSFDQILADGAAEATRKFYTFDGWYTASVGGSKYKDSGNTMPAKEVTVYAHWVRSSNEVIYKDWDGKELDKQEVVIGGNAIPPADPARVGYTFIGWDKPSTNIQTDTIITAQYSKNDYTLTLDGNGGMIDGSTIEEHDITYGNSFDQILIDGKNKVSRSGHTFEGWYSAPIGGNHYSYSGNLMMPNDLILYAHWKEKSYTVSFDTDHEKWTGGVIQRVYIDGTELGSLPAPEIYGWEFLGWWTGRNGTGEKLTESTKTETQDVTYYGNWKVKQFIIHFDKNLNAVEKNPEDKIVTYGETVGNLPVINAEGYTFLGWYTAPTGGDKIIETTPAPLGETTYYAHWDKKLEPTEPEPSNPGPSKPDTTNESGKNEETKPVDPGIDTNTKPTVPDTGGSFTVNPEDPRDVTYTKPDGTVAKDEWVGDGEDWYHVDENGKLSYDWFLEGERTWYKLNKQPGEKFGAALIGWNYEPMDGKKYFFDPANTKMLIGWQKIDGNWYYFTERNVAQTYYGSNPDGWLYDETKPGKPYGSMYQNERTPDGYLVDENGVCIKKEEV
jgi:uncharacterized repeat protein (TIGR02543 family)